MPVIMLADLLPEWKAGSPETSRPSAAFPGILQLLSTAGMSGEAAETSPPTAVPVSSPRLPKRQTAETAPRPEVQNAASTEMPVITSAPLVQNFPFAPAAPPTPVKTDRVETHVAPHAEAKASTAPRSVLLGTAPKVSVRSSDVELPDPLRVDPITPDETPLREEVPAEPLQVETSMKAAPVQTTPVRVAGVETNGTKPKDAVATEPLRVEGWRLTAGTIPMPGKAAPVHPGEDVPAETPLVDKSITPMPVKAVTAKANGVESWRFPAAAMPAPVKAVPAQPTGTVTAEPMLVDKARTPTPVKAVTVEAEGTQPTASLPAEPPRTDSGLLNPSTPPLPVKFAHVQDDEATVATEPPPVEIPVAPPVKVEPQQAQPNETGATVPRPVRLDASPKPGAQLLAGPIAPPLKADRVEPPQAESAPAPRRQTEPFPKAEAPAATPPPQRSFVGAVPTTVRQDHLPQAPAEPAGGRRTPHSREAQATRQDTSTGVATVVPSPAPVAVVVPEEPQSPQSPASSQDKFVAVEDQDAATTPFIPEALAKLVPGSELAFAARVVQIDSSQNQAPQPAVTFTPEEPRVAAKPAPVEAVRPPRREERNTPSDDAPEMIKHDAADPVPIRWQSVDPPENRTPASRPETLRPEIPAAARMQEAPQVREAPQIPAAARSIQLQFSGGEGRVQVQLVERAGEVQVAVHTPDARLAGALREDLPQLAAKLEQSGFRAETWHEAAALPAARTQESTASAFRQDLPDSPNGNPGSREQQQQQQQRQPVEDPRETKPPGQDFSWLFSSLQ